MPLWGIIGINALTLSSLNSNKQTNNISPLYNINTDAMIIVKRKPIATQLFLFSTNSESLAAIRSICGQLRGSTSFDLTNTSS